MISGMLQKSDHEMPSGLVSAKIVVTINCRQNSSSISIQLFAMDPPPPFEFIYPADWKPMDSTKLVLFKKSVNKLRNADAMQEMMLMRYNVKGDDEPSTICWGYG
jgi:hypothetical protein